VIARPEGGLARHPIIGPVSCRRLGLTVRLMPPVYVKLMLVLGQLQDFTPQPLLS
jgi:hypothetical protein